MLTQFNKKIWWGQIVKQSLLFQKLETAWLDPHLFHTVYLDEKYEVYVSYVPSRQQHDTIERKLDDYNSNHINRAHKLAPPITALLRYRGKNVASTWWMTNQDSLLLGCLDLIKPSDNLLANLLWSLISKVSSSIKQIYIPSLNKTNSIIKNLKVVGFDLIETGHPMQITAQIQISRLLKNIQSYLLELPDFSFDIVSQNNFNAEKLKDLNDDINLRADKKDFSVIIRSLSEEILGGIYCEAHEKHLYIKMLWIHDSIRRKKFGTKLIMIAEENAKNMSCIDSGVSTASFHAPKFYKKLGYKNISSSPLGPYRVFQYKKLLSL